MDLKNHLTFDIIDKDFNVEWWSDQIELDIEFDFKEHPDILESLHEAVRRYVPIDEQEECENCWEDGYSNVLIASVIWMPRKLRIIQDFLDEVNHILKPILHECKGSGSGKWYMKKAPFAYAMCNWTDDGFQIVGTEL